MSSLTKGAKVSHQLGSGRKGYLFVIEGKARVNGNEMKTRDAARIENEHNIEISASVPTELILLDLPEKYAINN